MFLVDSLAARIYSNITQRNLNDPAPQDIQDIINHIVPVSPNDLKNRNNLKEHK